MSRWLPRRWVLGLAAAACGLLVGAPHRAPAGDQLPPPQWVGAAAVRGAARLTWVRNPAFAKVRVYRKGPREPGFRPLAETPGNIFVDADVAPGGAYAYRLRGLGPDGVEGPPSMEISVRMVVVRLLPPTVPEWEGHLPVEGGVGLRWAEQPGRDVIAFNVYRRTPPDPEYALVGSTRSTSFRDGTVEVGRTYAYALTALDSALTETPRSADLEVALAPPAPPAPGLAPPAAWKVRRTRLVALVTEGEGAPLLRPADVAAGPATGSFYLADSGRRRVFVYSGAGVFQRSVGGAVEGGFRNLLGVAVGPRETLYAVDGGRNAVQAFGRTGRPGARLEVRPAPYPGAVGGIIDAAVDPDGGLFVVDNRSGVVLAYGPPGTEPRPIGGHGAGPGYFSAPTFCAFGPDGELHVADALNARVQVFSRTGELLRAFGSYRRGPGGFGRPKGIAVSPAGEVYVADSWFNVVQVFDREGAFLAVLGDEEGRVLDLGSPNGVALAPGGRSIAIAERLAGRLQIREMLP